MKSLLVAFALGTVSCWAQMPRPVAPATIAPGMKGVAHQLIRPFEEKMDQQIALANRRAPIDIVLRTRGFYLQGVGVIFSTEVELMQTPTLNPWHQSISADEKATVYQTKTTNLELLKNCLKSTMTASAKDMDFLSPNDQIVWAINLAYQPWENMKGLPSQIVMRAKRQNAMTGDITTEVQFQ